MLTTDNSGSPQKVSHEDASLDVLALAAEPGNGADVVGDHHKRGAGEVLLARLPRTLADVHLPEAAGHDVPGQAEPVVVPAVDVLHQLVHPLVVAPGRQLQRLLEGGALGEEAAEAEEGAAP